MSVPSSDVAAPPGLAAFAHWGIFWLLAATMAAGVFFANGIDALLYAWQLPEYSHGPLIPVLSALLFLRQLKDFPPQPGPKPDRWPGVALVAVSLVFGALGILANIDDIVAYALILWVGGLLLVSFGWRTGRHFWPPVLHLVYMLPLPGVIYYKVSTSLQFLSSEMGVWFLQILSVPVFLDGNIIDLGVTKLHVAEACSGLRYMFPILSFSYIFAVLYRGPMWQKAVLLISAVPIAILMNSIRIAVAGIIVQHYGLDWLEGFTHFFEGWVIFLSCIAILFFLAWLMLFLHPEKPSLANALDLEISGLGPQLMRLQYVRPSAALITAALMALAAAAAILTLPDRGGRAPARENFALFPRQIGDWQQQGSRQYLSAQVAEVLAADDYHQVDLVKPGEATPVGLFMAWYDDQSDGGVHSPEICLPGSGWEIAWLERSDITAATGSDSPFLINRAIIQKGETRMMVFYWFQQKHRRLAWDFAAKYWLMVDGIMTGRTDGAIVRLTTMIGPSEPDAVAEARLMEVLQGLQHPLPRFIPNE
ncbi:VPLPA-CTERM-specific exosortase XrtD [Sedimentitalea sp. HM32M-2]|uniref:VPLPA-CTERM-specific exosortase XrtD n=1 Tax=Sedimentitalea sp. HM32M-2 TaxID=3351566 RepID=UPI003636DB42